MTEPTLAAPLAEAHRDATARDMALIYSGERKWITDDNEAFTADTLAALRANPRTVEAMAEALRASDLIRRYDEYSRAAHPATMRGTPLDELARSWAAAILDALLGPA